MTLGTADKTNQADVKAQAQASPETRQDGNEERTKETYTAAEVEALKKTWEGKLGGKARIERDTFKTQLAEVSKERDTLKSQLEAVNGEIVEAKEQIADVSKNMEALNDDDPDKKVLKARIKELEEGLKVLKKEKTDLEPIRQYKANQDRDDMLISVASEYGAETSEDYNRFMEKADRLKLDNRERLVALAETMGLKAKGEDEGNKKQPHDPDSGRNAGGGIDLDTLSPREKIEEGLKRAKRK